MNKFKFLNITLAVGVSVNISVAAEKKSLMILDHENEDIAYIITPAKSLDSYELSNLKSDLTKQDLRILSKQINNNIKSAKNSYSNQNTLDLINYIKSLTGVETEVSIVDLRSMVLSTQEEIVK